MTSRSTSPALAHWAAGSPASVSPAQRPPGPVYTLASDRAVRLHVHEAALACCSMEIAAAIGLGLLPAVAIDDPPAQLHILVVSGTVTDAMAPAVVAAWQQLPQPRVVLSYGACSNTGGPYWDSAFVTKGIDVLLPVACYLPGCPPRPQALIAAVAALRQQLTTADVPADSGR